MYPVKENINKVEEILEESIKNVEQRDKNREKMKDRLRGVKDEVRRSNIPLSRTYRKKTGQGQYWNRWRLTECIRSQGQESQ